MSFILGNCKILLFAVFKLSLNFLSPNKKYELWKCVGRATGENWIEERDGCSWPLSHSARMKGGRNLGIHLKENPVGPHDPRA